MERLFQQAMELNPENTYAMKQHGTFLKVVADYKELNDNNKQLKNSGVFAKIKK